MADSDDDYIADDNSDDNIGNSTAHGTRSNGPAQDSRNTGDDANNRRAWEDIQRSWDTVIEGADGSIGATINSLRESNQRKRYAMCLLLLSCRTHSADCLI